MFVVAIIETVIRKQGVTYYAAYQVIKEKPVFPAMLYKRLFRRQKFLGLKITRSGKTILNA